MNIYIDTETTGLDPFVSKITLIQVLQGDTIRIIKNLNPAKIKELESLFESNLVIGHNLKFDLKFLKHHYNIEPTNIFDTYIAELVLSGGSYARVKGASSLDTLAKKYANYKLNKTKELKTSFNSTNLTADQVKYAAEDVAVLPSIYYKQLAALKGRDLMETFNIENKCVQASVWLELSGIPIDVSLLEELRKKTIQDMKNTEEKIGKLLLESGYTISTLTGLAPKPVNLNSPKELLTVLNFLKIPVTSTGDSILSTIKHPIGELLRDYRTQQKLLTGFLETYPDYINPVTKRIHPSYSQYGTNTGRYTSSNPNLQQVPREKEVRSIFKAPPGYKIITADYSQIELRIIAELSQEPEFIRIYKSNGDLHKKTASLITGKPESEVTKKERQEAKPVNFGFAYGLGPESFKQKAKDDYGIEISLEQATFIQQRFFAGYPVLQNYLKKASTIAMQNQCIINKAKRLVNFDENLEPWRYANFGKNAPVQSLSADITKIAMGELYRVLKPFNAQLINTVHDELVFLVADEYVAICSKYIQEVMEKASQTYITSIPAPVEIAVSQEWSK